MHLFDLSSFSLTAAVLLMAFAGGLTAYLSAWASATARQLREDQALLPALAVSAAKVGFVGPWLGYAVTGAIAGTLLVIAHPLSPAVLVLMAVCLPACVMDLELMVIPEELTWTLLFAGALISPWHAGADDAVIGAALATGALWLSLAAVEYSTGRNMRAGGDIAAAAAGGAWVGMSLSGVYVLSACLVFSCYYLALRYRNDEGWVPLGPALLAAIPVAPHLKSLTDSISLSALSIA
jgi:prepilin signal peptidase PulO-like enzyme (type II secretory pathway)|nr:prepilin peptidase [Neorhizobium tomejilense]